MVLFIFLLLMGCETVDHPTSKTVNINGRYQQGPVYKAEIPPTWVSDLPAKTPLDTMQPIATFKIDQVVITVHNFPGQKIPPEAQIERWKRQMGTGEVSKHAHGGFGGLRYETEGCIAYAMQVTPVLYRIIPEMDKRADYTIKAVGPDVDQYANEIDQFVNSFEWIEPVALCSVF